MRKKFIFGVVSAALVLLAFTSCQVGSIFMSSNSPSANEVAAPTFDGPLPAGVHFTSAVATIQLTGNLAGASTSVDVHRITGAWEENSVTWNSFGGRYHPDVITSFPVNGPGSYSFDISSLVQGWSNGDYPNHGFLLRIEGYGYLQFASSEASDLGLLPFIVATFGTETVVFRRGTANDIADTTILENYPDANEGAAHSLLVRGNYTLEKHALLKFDVPFIPREGYTRTIGYWKNHAGLGPGNQADMVTQYLPLWLGTPGGLKSVEVTTNLQAVDILSRTDGGGSNGIAKLMSQLLAAKLNFAAGASNTVSDAVSIADAFLAENAVEDWTKRMVYEGWKITALASVLDDYNNGLMGVPHAD